MFPRRFGSTQGAPRRPSCQPALSATLPLRMTTSVLSQALRTPRAGQLPLIINWISLWPLQVTLSVQRRRPPSLTSAFSPRARPSHVTLVEVCDQTHEYCELFMIICSLSIQSHDKLGAAVFKLMIIFVCCIQTQLIVFMPNAEQIDRCHARQRTKNHCALTKRHSAGPDGRADIHTNAIANKDYTISRTVSRKYLL